MPVGRIICHVKTVPSSLSGLRKFLLALFSLHNDDGHANVALVEGVPRGEGKGELFGFACYTPLFNLQLNTPAAGAVHTACGGELSSSLFDMSYHSGPQAELGLNVCN